MEKTVFLSRAKNFLIFTRSLPQLSNGSISVDIKHDRVVVLNIHESLTAAGPRNPSENHRFDFDFCYSHNEEPIRSADRNMDDPSNENLTDYIRFSALAGFDTVAFLNSFNESDNRDFLFKRSEYLNSPRGLLHNIFTDTFHSLSAAVSDNGYLHLSNSVSLKAFEVVGNVIVDLLVVYPQVGVLYQDDVIGTWSAEKCVQHTVHDTENAMETLSQAFSRRMMAVLLPCTASQFVDPKNITTLGPLGSIVIQIEVEQLLFSIQKKCTTLRKSRMDIVNLLSQNIVESLDAIKQNPTKSWIGIAPSHELARLGILMDDDMLCHVPANFMKFVNSSVQLSEWVEAEFTREKQCKNDKIVDEVIHSIGVYKTVTEQVKKRALVSLPHVLKRLESLERTNTIHVAYNDSLLTRVLQPYFEGGWNVNIVTLTAKNNPSLESVLHSTENFDLLTSKINVNEVDIDGVTATKDFRKHTSKNQGTSMIDSAHIDQESTSFSARENEIASARGRYYDVESLHQILSRIGKYLKGTTLSYEAGLDSLVTDGDVNQYFETKISDLYIDICVNESRLILKWDPNEFLMKLKSIGIEPFREQRKKKPVSSHDNDISKLRQKLSLALGRSSKYDFKLDLDVNEEIHDMRSLRQGLSPAFVRKTSKGLTEDPPQNRVSAEMPTSLVTVDETDFQPLSRSSLFGSFGVLQSAELAGKIVNSDFAALHEQSLEKLICDDSTEDRNEIAAKLDVNADTAVTMVGVGKDKVKVIESTASSTGKCDSGNDYPKFQNEVNGEPELDGVNLTFDFDEYIKKVPFLTTGSPYGTISNNPKSSSKLKSNLSVKIPTMNYKYDEETSTKSGGGRSSPGTPFDRMQPMRKASSKASLLNLSGRRSSLKSKLGDVADPEEGKRNLYGDLLDKSGGKVTAKPSKSLSSTGNKSTAFSKQKTPSKLTLIDTLHMQVVNGSISRPSSAGTPAKPSAQLGGRQPFSPFRQRPMSSPQLLPSNLTLKLDRTEEHIGIEDSPMDRSRRELLVKFEDSILSDEGVLPSEESSTYCEKSDKIDISVVTNIPHYQPVLSVPRTSLIVNYNDYFGALVGDTQSNDGKQSEGSIGFIKSQIFSGAKAGFYFTVGSRGLGYYADSLHKVPLSDAFNTATGGNPSSTVSDYNIKPATITSDNDTGDDFTSGSPSEEKTKAARAEVCQTLSTSPEDTALFVPTDYRSTDEPQRPRTTQSLVSPIFSHNMFETNGTDQNNIATLTTDDQPHQRERFQDLIMKDETKEMMITQAVRGDGDEDADSPAKNPSKVKRNPHKVLETIGLQHPKHLNLSTSTSKWVQDSRSTHFRPVSAIDREKRRLQKLDLERRSAARFLNVVESGNVELAEKMLAQNPKLLLLKNGFGRDAVHIAIKIESIKMLDMLHQHGASLGSRGPTGDSVLHLASACGNVHVLAWLIAHGVDKDVTDMSGQSAVHSAARFGQIDSLKFLFSIGLDFEVGDDIGKKPIDCVPDAPEKDRRRLEKLINKATLLNNANK